MEYVPAWIYNMSLLICVELQGSSHIFRVRSKRRAMNLFLTQQSYQSEVEASFPGDQSTF